MSTECQILVEGCDTILHLRIDGYPDEVLPKLCECLTDFCKHERLTSLPGCFMSYLAGWLNRLYQSHQCEGLRPNENGPDYYAYLKRCLLTYTCLTAYDTTRKDPLVNTIKYLYLIRYDYIQIRIPKPGKFGVDDHGARIENTKLHSLVDFTGKPFQKQRQV